MESIVFSVKDTGPGMPSRIEDHFLPYSFDSKFHRGGVGSGLGMELSYRFCKMMGGEMSVENFPEVGTTVTVRLPVNPPN